MNLKKVIIVFLLAFVMPFGCCDRVKPYWEISEFRIPAAGNHHYVSVDTVTTDTLWIALEFEVDYVESSPLIFNSGSSLFASSCPDDGEKGSMDPVTEIKVTSDHALHGIPAGQPIDSLCRFLFEDYHSGDFYSVGDFIPLFNEQMYRTAPGWVAIIGKPTSGFDHVFSVKITMQSGFDFSDSTHSLHWE